MAKDLNKALNEVDITYDQIIQMYSCGFVPTYR